MAAKKGVAAGCIPWAIDREREREREIERERAATLSYVMLQLFCPTCGTFLYCKRAPTGVGATLNPVWVESRDNSRQRNSAIPYEDDASTSNAGPERVDLTADLTVRRLPTNSLRPASNTPNSQAKLHVGGQRRVLLQAVPVQVRGQRDGAMTLTLTHDASRVALTVVDPDFADPRDAPNSGRSPMRFP